MNSLFPAQNLFCVDNGQPVTELTHEDFAGAVFLCVRQPDVPSLGFTFGLLCAPS